MCVVIFEPDFTRLFESPLLSSTLGNFENFNKSFLHSTFDVAHVSFYWRLKCKSVVPLDNFSILGLHTNNLFPWAFTLFIEKNEFHSIEAISHVGVNQFGVLSIR